MIRKKSQSRGVAQDEIVFCRPQYYRQKSPARGLHRILYLNFQSHETVERLPERSLTGNEFLDRVLYFFFLIIDKDFFFFLEITEDIIGDIFLSYWPIDSDP